MTVTHIANPFTAIETIRHEHDRLAEAIVVTVDFLGDVQAGERLNLANLRRTNTLRDSLRAREAALEVLGREYQDWGD